MFTLRIILRACAIAALIAMTPAAHAQFAVVDVGAIMQLIQQIEVMREQLTTAEEQLSQAQEEYAAMTGGRRMEQLLRGVERNYPRTISPETVAIRQASLLNAAVPVIVTSFHPRSTAISTSARITAVFSVWVTSLRP